MKFAHFLCSHKSFIFLDLAVLQNLGVRNTRYPYSLWTEIFFVSCVAILCLRPHLSSLPFPMDESEREELEENPQGYRESWKRLKKVMI